MGLIILLQNQLKEAMKSGDTERRDTIRFLQSALKNTAIEVRKSTVDLSDDEALVVVRRLAKQRKESIVQYRNGGREDLAQCEERELKILNEFLPAEMPEEEVRKLVAEVIAECGATSLKEQGKVIGMTMKKGAGCISGEVLQRIVKTYLS